jgi:hypothetical protein
MKSRALPGARVRVRRLPTAVRWNGLLAHVGSVTYTKYY